MTDTPTTDALIAEAVEHLMNTRRIGTASLNEYQRDADAADMRDAYTDILTKAAPFLQRAGASGEREAGRRPGWDLDGMCDEHGRFACQKCAIIPTEADEAPGVEIPAGIIAACTDDGGYSVPERWPDGSVKRRNADGDVLHGCEMCDGDDECTCPGNVGGRKSFGATPIAQPIAPSREAVDIAYEAYRRGYSDSAEDSGVTPDSECMRDGWHDWLHDCEELKIDTPDAAKSDAVRLRGQNEGFAAAVQWLRDRSATKPPASLSHAATVLADDMEQSRIAALATPTAPSDQA